MLKVAFFAAASALAAALLASAVPAQTPPSPPPGDLTAAPRYGGWGFDMAGRDLSVKPGDDFLDYAAGGYLKSLKIPSDQARWGAFNMLRDLSDNRVHAILEAAALKSGPDPETDEAKIGAFYRAFMDAGAIEAKGVRPLAAELAAIASASDRSRIAALMGRSMGGFGGSIFGLGVDVDAHEPTRYILSVEQDGLGLPDRDYYLDAKFAAKKAAYQVYATRLLTLLGWPDAEARAADVVAFETSLAQAQWARAERRDRDKTYNPTSVEALAQAAPGFDWRAFLDGAGLPRVERLNVRENTAAPRIAAAFAQAPLDTLKAWEAVHLADSAADVLPAAFVEAKFDFRGKALAGTPELKARWKRAVDLVGSLQDGMGDAVGRAYVALYFPPSSKAEMEALVENLRSAFHDRIEHSDWMSPQTKAQALDKLADYKIMIGYTTEWRDYAGLRIRPDDLFGDAERSRAAS